MRKSTKWLAAGSVVSGIAGYITGILTAPKSGKETREDIKETAMSAKAEAEKQLKKLHSELDVLISRGTDRAGQLKTEAKADIESAVSKARTAINPR